MLRRSRIGACEQEAIVGVVTLCGPHLLTVDNPLISVEYRGGLQACKVATTVWFAESLAPTHLAAQNLWQELFLLFFSSPLQQRWTNKRVAKEVCAHRSLRVCEFFCKHHTLQRAQTFAAVFRWPRCTDPTASKQLARPFKVELLTLFVGHFKTFVEPALWQVLGEPGFYFNAECFGFWGVSQHLPILPVSDLWRPCRETTTLCCVHHAVT